MKKKFVLSRDKNGFADGIYYSKQLVCHFNPGTCINEKYSVWLIGILNGTRQKLPK